MQSSPPRIPLPDLPAARRALGGMRHAAQQGMALLQESVERAPLPAPVASVAGSVLRRVDHLARHADAAAASVAHNIFAVAGLPLEDERDLSAVAAALGKALDLLGVEGARLDETALRRACRSAAAPLRDTFPRDAAWAARLTLSVLDAQAVRPASAYQLRQVRIAIFGTMLAFAEPRDLETALASAVALAAALEREIEAAGRDQAALAQLFTEFAPHV